jgi:hypothetical protein
MKKTIIHRKNLMYDFNIKRIQFKLIFSGEGFFEPFFGRIMPIGYKGFRIQFLWICFQWVVKQ